MPRQPREPGPSGGESGQVEGASPEKGAPGHGRRVARPDRGIAAVLRSHDRPFPVAARGADQEPVAIF